MSIKVGDRHEKVFSNGTSVVRVCVGHAYPKNGNLHNPSPRFNWEARASGKLVGVAYSRNGAVEILKIFKEES